MVRYYVFVKKNIETHFQFEHHYLFNKNGIIRKNFLWFINDHKKLKI